MPVTSLQLFEWQASFGTPVTDDDSKWRVIKNYRKDLMNKSEWTQLEDAEIDKQAAKDYRKTLRDLEKDYDNPDEVVFPDPPFDMSGV